MSGHSHAKTIKHQKNITDQKRGQVFSKLARVISVAVKEGGPNPETNYKLRIAMEAAKASNMPKENVERAMKKGSGDGEGEKLEEVVFEAYGPGGVAVIIEGIADNKNRALGEVKQALNQFGGKLVGEGGVRWMFERKGTVTVNPGDQTEGSKSKEELELLAIEVGAQDIYWHDELLDIYTKPEELEQTKKSLEQKGIKIDSYSLDWVPKEEIAVDEQSKGGCQKLFDALDELESVQDIYSNIKL
ncbi:MAG: YebC/PmpR family DNA-binding transcriptional regulator [Candidatus Nealsonbacteria bacterium]|nr:YebC/PmpR family DNA-binding transcriptional regulator [Candidatus Nealsonbacteria bacterium]